MKKTLRPALWAMVSTIVVQTGMAHAVPALLLGKRPSGGLESSGCTAWAIESAIALAATLVLALLLGRSISLYRPKRSTHR